MNVIARLSEAKKIYQTPAGQLVALDSTNMELRTGELLLIIGPSGSGKTTLLSLIGCLIDPTAGSVEINGQGIDKMDAGKKAEVRLNTIGFVFQQFNLLAPLTAKENVEFPLKMQRLSSTLIKEKTNAAIKKVGMTSHKLKFPNQLSGGQQQRVAIARALVTDPQIILCDEPTASLDEKSMTTVMQELQELARNGKAVAVVTHDPRLKKYADRAIEVENGIASEIDLNKTAFTN